MLFSPQLLARRSFKAAAGGLATNYLLKTQAFDDAAWTKGIIASVTANATTAPDSSSTADLLFPSGSSTDSAYVQQQVTLGTQQITLSVYAKPNSWQWLAISIYDGIHHYSWFDVLNGVTGAAASGASISISAASNGYYRCVVTFTITGANPYGVFQPVDADNSLVETTSGSNGVYLWGAQLETGGSATTYNPNL